MIVIVAEKPSVAREIAAVVGASARRQGYFESPTHLVTWAVGHLVRLGEPQEVCEQWGSPWRAHVLPMLPAEWPLFVIDRSRAQYGVVARLLCARSTTKVICATDAGREGELIFRMIYARSGCQRPVHRLWISSLTAQAIASGLRAMKPGSHYDALAAAASARAKADWLVGMNLSRAYHLARGVPTSVGRVQTPTLAFVVRRDADIAAFVPTPFRQVRATFDVEGVGSVDAAYVRMVEGADGIRKLSSHLPLPSDSLRPDDDADQVVARARGGVAKLLSVEGATTCERPPQLLDLTSLQRLANRLWGWTAASTLEVAQALYEARLISYPRSDSRYLSTDVAATLGMVVAGIAAPYRAWLVPDTGSRALSKRFVDDAKVTDHHALIPTGVSAAGLAAETREAQLYDLLCRRLLQAWQEELLLRRSEAVYVIENDGLADRYVAKGTTVLREGWRALEVRGDQAPVREPALPSGLRAGLPIAAVTPRILVDKTKPTPHFTEADLLRVLETGGVGGGDELAETLKEKGLGTPATRAAIIETLLRRGYLARVGKSLRATEAGAALIKSVDPSVTSAAMTAEMERSLRRIERGDLAEDAFVAELERFVAARVKDALKDGLAPWAPAPKRASGACARAPGRKSTRKRVAGGGHEPTKGVRS